MRVELFRQSLEFNEKSLKMVLVPELYQLMHHLYKSAIQSIATDFEMMKQNSNFYFQKMLQTVIGWSEESWNGVLTPIESEVPLLSGFLRSILTQRMLIASSFRKSINEGNGVGNGRAASLRIPTNRSFLKQCIIKCCDRFHLLPVLFTGVKENNSQFLKFYTKANEYIEQAIDLSILTFLPLFDIFTNSALETPDKWFIVRQPPPPGTMNPQQQQQRPQQPQQPPRVLSVAQHPQQQRAPPPLRPPTTIREPGEVLLRPTREARQMVAGTQPQQPLQQKPTVSVSIDQVQDQRLANLAKGREKLQQMKSSQPLPPPITTTTNVQQERHQPPPPPPPPAPSQLQRLRRNSDEDDDDENDEEDERPLIQFDHSDDSADDDDDEKENRGEEEDEDFLLSKLEHNNPSASLGMDQQSLKE